MLTTSISKVYLLSSSFLVDAFVDLRQRLGIGFTTLFNGWTRSAAIAAAAAAAASATTAGAVTSANIIPWAAAAVSTRSATTATATAERVHDVCPARHGR